LGATCALVLVETEQFVVLSYSLNLALKTTGHSNAIKCTS